MGGACARGRREFADQRQLHILGVLGVSPLFCHTVHSSVRGHLAEVNHRITHRGVLQEDFMDAPPAYQYTVSLHWAVGQIALGAIETMPTNSCERILFVLTMMFGFCFGSTLISTLSAAMMDYHMMQQDRTTKLRRLKQYLSENKVWVGCVSGPRPLCLKAAARTRALCAHRTTPAMAASHRVGGFRGWAAAAGDWR